MNGNHYYPELVRKARIAAGFKTQQEAADHFEKRLETIQRIENGRNASYELLAAMAADYKQDVRTWMKPLKNLPDDSTPNVENTLT